VALNQEKGVMTEELTYSFTREVDVEQLQNLFQQTDWAARRTIRDLQKMLDNTSYCLTVWQTDRLVGFARVLTDDVYRGLLDDVVVGGEFRGHDVGREMLNRIVERFGHLEELLLGCHDELVPFYEKFGFKVEKHPHMALKPDARTTD
jgi:GNAT superfamily N-acetyltransferase